MKYRIIIAVLCAAVFNLGTAVGAEKTIRFDKYGYTITCSVKNKSIENNSAITIELKDGSFIEGRYFSSGNLDGKMVMGTGQFIEGSFILYNHSGLGISINKKEAGNIRIDCSSIKLHVGDYNGLYSFLSRNDKSSTTPYSLTITGNDWEAMLPITQDCVNKNAGKPLSNYITGSMTGSLKVPSYSFAGTLHELASVYSVVAPKEGLGIRYYKDGRQEYIKVLNDEYLIGKSLNIDGKIIGFEETKLKKLDVAQDDIWNNVSHFVENGNTVLKFTNGDYFTGNINGEWKYGCPIDGETTLRDGTILKGDWFKQYSINDQTESVLKSKTYPSEKRDALISAEYDEKVKGLRLLISQKKFKEAYQEIDKIINAYPNKSPENNKLKDELSMSEKLSDEALWGRILFFDQYSRYEHRACWDLDLATIYSYNVKIQERTYSFKFGEWEMSSWSNFEDLCSYDAVQKIFTIGSQKGSFIGTHYVQYDLDKDRINILKKENYSEDKITGTTFINSPVNGKYRMFNYQSGEMSYGEFSYTSNGDLIPTGSKDYVYNSHHRLTRYTGYSRVEFTWANGRITACGKELVEYISFNEYGYWTQCRIYEKDNDYPNGIKYIKEYRRTFTKR